MGRRDSVWSALGIIILSALIIIVISLALSSTPTEQIIERNYFWMVGCFAGWWIWGRK
jgi:uncharacterized membrane protein